MFGFLRKLFGDKRDRDLKEIRPVVDKINQEFDKLKNLTNDELRNKTNEFRQFIKEYIRDIDQALETRKQESINTNNINKKQDLFAEIDRLKKERDIQIEKALEQILPQAFAVVREAARRFKALNEFYKNKQYLNSDWSSKPEYSFLLDEEERKNNDIPSLPLLTTTVTEFDRNNYVKYVDDKILEKLDEPSKILYRGMSPFEIIVDDKGKEKIKWDATYTLNVKTEKLIDGTYSKAMQLWHKCIQGDSFDKIVNMLTSSYTNVNPQEHFSNFKEFNDYLTNKIKDENTSKFIVNTLSDALAQKWDMEHYKEQLIGGIVLHRGKIAEMATGEGKTLVSTLPAYLNALAGEGVHIVTVNDYLAKRDSEWNKGDLLNFLMMKVDCIDNHRPNSEARKKAYEADITYGTNSEFGFDYLRDNMVFSAEEKVQGKFHYAIVDEVDSVLIDDARTPLIISGPAVKDGLDEMFKNLKPIVERLVNRQREIVNNFLKSARVKIAAGDTGVEEKLNKEGQMESGGGLDLFRAYRGLPKNRALIKYLSEPGIATILQKTENHYMQEQSRNMHKADAPLLFTLEEKNRKVVLTNLGNEFLSKGNSDPKLFILDDIGVIVSEIEKNTRLSESERNTAKDEAIRNYSAKIERLHALSQLLKAYTLFDREDEYVVIEGKVKIVDEQTGRIMEGRRYSDGLHQAIEAKEGVDIEGSTQTYATVTLQNFFRMYHKLSGMTGTAETDAQEFWDIYKLEVLNIPTHKPMVREDKQDLVYKTDKEKYNAIIEEIVRLRDKGRSVLVGTTSVEKSEVLSRLLNMRSIPHNVLNAKQHAREAEIVALAGQKGQITIATNMAGRGTDIKLSEEVRKAGGLAIIGTERHDSRRVDRQLRGRAGRQGDVGSSQFYVSLEDKLMRLFGSERISRLMDRFGHKEGDVLQHSMITKSIERAQKKVEESNFGVRKRLLEYDDVMNIQREAIYKRRTNALSEERLTVELYDLFLDLVYELIEKYKPENNFEKFKEELLLYFGVEPNFDVKAFKETDFNKLAHSLHDIVMGTYYRKFNTIIQMIMPVIEGVYNTPNSKYTRITIPFTNGVKGIEINADLKSAVESGGKSLIRDIEKAVALVIIDQAWKEHLRNMDELKDQVQSVSFAQKDPLVEYKIQARSLFRSLNSEINQELASFLFHGMVPVQQESQIQQAPKKVKEVQTVTNVSQESEEEVDNDDSKDNQPKVEKPQPIKAEPKIGRNDLCFCNSGKKFKHCHGK